MAKKRKLVDDEEFINDDNQQRSCTTLDHVYPAGATADTRCFCGKRQMRPFIKLDDYLKEGDVIRMISDGPLWRVEMVNQSRARCRMTTARREVERLDTKALGPEVSSGPVFMPIPGTEEADSYDDSLDDAEEVEDQGKLTNISPKSAVQRVSRAELEKEAHPTRSNTVAKVAGIPVAGKSTKQAEADRRAKLANKPKGEARPLTGAAAKAKAGAREKAPRTVRKCGCGCGEETMSYFVPGHDARYKGWLKKVGDGRLSLDELKGLMGKATFAKYVFKKSGAGFVTKQTYQEVAG